MPRLPEHTLESVPEASRPALEAMAKKMGRVRTMHAQMAHAPAVIHGYAALRKAIAEHAQFDAPTQEAIALAVGESNDCHYCQSSHTIAAVRHGFTEEQTVKIRTGDVDWDPKLAALVTFVKEAAEFVGDVSDATWAAAEEAGWTDEELAETGVHLAVNLFTNYFNHLARTELDIDLAPGLEVSQTTT